MDHKLNYIKSILIGALLFITVNGAYAQYSGTNLRGQIQFLNSNSKKLLPLSNATVDLYYSPSPEQFILVKETVTNANGFYYFYGIQPGNGNFYIQVNKAKNYQLTVTSLSYTGNKYNYNQFQDVAIINF